MAALPLVAILRGLPARDAISVGEALIAAGFRLIEVPLTSSDAFDAIKRLVRDLGDRAVIGAGTVRTLQDVDMLVAAGGQLMVTPHADTALIRHAASWGLATLPGIMTPTEAFAALDAGASALKIFPAEIIQPGAIRALRTVLGPQVALCPTGGITPDNMADYLTAGASGFGLGGSLYRPGESPGQVEQHARAFVTAWQEWKNATDD
ncbi:MAG: 2-dehydro-3-deoxy-6-phosphogalactonate aldolase [Pseudomonadota bacterium]